MVTEAKRNRTARLGWMILALWGMLAGSAGWMAYAQRAAVRGNYQRVASPGQRTLPSGRLKPLVGAQAPTLDLRRINPNTLPQSAKGRPGAAPQVAGHATAQAQVGALATFGAAPPQAPPPYFDLTTVPRPPQVGDSTLSLDQHPVYTADQRFIFFDSNRANVDGTAVIPRFHVWQMTADGNSVFPVTGTTTSGPRGDEFTGDQIFPAVNASGNLLAFLHRSPSSIAQFQLYIINLSNGIRTQLTGLANQKDVFGNLVSFVNLGRPTWTAGGQLAFSAQNANTAGDRPNIWIIDPSTIVTRNVTNVTPGSLLDAIEPAARRVGSEDRITFASTATATGAGGGTLAAATARNGLHYLWEVRILTPTTVAFTQLTSAAGADDREPAWNNSTGSSYSGALAFSSRGRTSTAHYDIHWIPAGQGPTSGTPSTETGSTNVRTLLTPDNDPNVPVGFRNQTDETSPSWSTGASGVERIAHQANRIQVIVPPPPGSPPGTAGTVELRPSSTNLDIWTADVQDVNPPTLLPVDAASGVIVDIRSVQTNAQLGSAGDRFTFQARLQDIHSGITSVWAQIKDPDSSTQDAEGKEHKLYGYNDGPNVGFGLNSSFDGRKQGPPRGITHILHQSIEFDAEGVRADSAGGLPQFYRGGQETDGVGYSEYGSITVECASYIPGVDDANAWSGFFNPPLNDGRWLELTDPDGNGVFTATWDTPIVPSDYYVDIIAYDAAQNPVSPSQVGNWIIYDNIAGFSTQGLISRKQGLAVMDHALGQKWLRGLRGSFRNFPSWRFGTESEIIDESDTNQRDPDPDDPAGRVLRPRQTMRHDPASPCNPPAPFDFTDIRIEDYTTRTSPFGFGSNFATAIPMFGGPEEIVREPVLMGNNSSNPDPRQLRISCDNIIGDTYPHYGVDVWRILSKGPVPAGILDRYLPTVEAQPGDLLDTPGQRRAQIVSRRFVLWAAPYTGDVYAGAGTILDVNTQNRLKAFVEARTPALPSLPGFPQGIAQGGRLLIAGSDIAWALTGDTPNSNATTQPFLRDVLDAVYTGDSVGGEVTAVSANPLAELLTKDIFGLQVGGGGGGFTPRADCPIGFADNTPDELITPYRLPPFPTGAYNGQLNDGYPSTGVAPNVFPAGTAWSLMDGIAPLPNGRGSQILFDQRMIAREDAVTRAKVVYAGFGLHIMGRHYAAGGDPLCAFPDPRLNPANYVNQLYQLNYKSKIGHNIGCWFTTASVDGQVRDISDQTIPGALVVLRRGGQIVGSALSDSEGRFLVNGLPHGVWNIDVTSPGFISFSKPDAAYGHGLQQATVDVRLTQAPPGVLTGRVVDQAGSPVVGARVLATINASSLFKGQRTYEATTDQNGVYRIDPIATGTYFVTIEQPYPVGVGDPVTYIGSVAQPVPVNPAAVTSGVDFRMTAQAAPLTVRVFETVGGVRNGNLVVGASVTLTPATGAPIVGVTDSAGSFNAGTIPPGSYAYAVAHPQHTTATGTLSVPANSPVFEVDMELDNRPTFDVIGRVVLAAGGKLLDASSGLVVRAEQSGTLMGSATVTDPTGTPQRNFAFTGNNQLKQGTYDFVVTNPRFGTGRASGVVVDGAQGVIQIVLPGTPDAISGLYGG